MPPRKRLASRRIRWRDHSPPPARAIEGDGGAWQKGRHSTGRNRPAENRCWSPSRWHLAEHVRQRTTREDRQRGGARTVRHFDLEGLKWRDDRLESSQEGAVLRLDAVGMPAEPMRVDRKSTRLNSSHSQISY